MKKKLLIIIFGIFLFFLSSDFVSAACPSMCWCRDTGWCGTMSQYQHWRVDLENNICCFHPVCGSESCEYGSGCSTNWLDEEPLGQCCQCDDEGPYPYPYNCDYLETGWYCLGDGHTRRMDDYRCNSSCNCYLSSSETEDCNDQDGDYCANEYVLTTLDYFCEPQEGDDECVPSPVSTFSCSNNNECNGKFWENYKCGCPGLPNACECVFDDSIDCTLLGNYDGDEIECNCDCDPDYDVAEVVAGSAICNDGLDNDCDGKTDIYDDGCSDPPDARFSCDIEGCQPTFGCIGYVGPQSSCTFYLENDSTDPDIPPFPTEDDDYLKFEWDVLGYGSEPDDTCPYTQNPTGCRFTPANPPFSMPPGYYIMILRVEDLSGQFDTYQADFRLREDAKAGFECSLTGNDGDWDTACPDLEIFRRTTVYFRDNLTPPVYIGYEHSSYSEGAELITSRIWDVDGVVFDPDNNSLASAELASSSQDITLAIVDNEGRTASTARTVPITFIAPRWKEISPSF